MSLDAPPRAPAVAPTVDTAPASHAPLSYGAFVALVAALMASNAIATDMMLPALAHIGAALDVAEANDRQMVVSAYLIGFGAGQFLVGPLTDRFGRRPALLIGLTIFGLGGVACALSTSFPALLAARAAQGLGAAAPRVVVAAVVRDCYRGRGMAQVMSLAMMVFMVGPVLAPSIGQGVLMLSDWRGIFWVLTIYGLALLGFCALFLPETLRRERRRALDMGTLGGSLRAVVTERQTVGYAVAAGVFFGALFGFINSSQQVLGELYGLGPWFPLVFGGVATMIGAAAFVNAMFVQRLGMRRLSHGATVVFTAMGGLLALSSIALGGRPPLWLFLPLFTSAMFCVGLVFANFNALAMEPQGRQAGVASSLIGGATTLIGATIGFFVGQAYDGSVTPMALAYACCGALALGILLVTERGRLFEIGTR